MRRRMTSAQELNGADEFWDRLQVALAGVSVKLSEVGHKDKSDNLIKSWHIIETTGEQVLGEIDEEVSEATKEYERQHKMAGHL